MEHDERGDRGTRPLRPMVGREIKEPEMGQEMRLRTEDEMVEELFTYHAPDFSQQQQYAQVRAAAKTLALTILGACPPCADRSDAIRKVREAVMTANAAIALRGLV